MMIFEAEIINPDNVEVSIRARMTIGEWKRVRDALNAEKSDPICRYRKGIFNIEKAIEKTFADFQSEDEAQTS